MRITVRIPDDVGDTVKATTDNVSAYVTEALREKIERNWRREARQNVLDGIREYDGPGTGEGAEEQLHENRRTGDRVQVERLDSTRDTSFGSRTAPTRPCRCRDVLHAKCAGF